MLTLRVIKSLDGPVYVNIETIAYLKASGGGTAIHFAPDVTHALLVPLPLAVVLRQLGLSTPPDAALSEQPPLSLQVVAPTVQVLAAHDQPLAQPDVTTPSEPHA